MAGFNLPRACQCGDPDKINWDHSTDDLCKEWTTCTEPAPDHRAGVSGPDMINHPPHYTSSPAKCSGCGKTIECIDIVRHMMFDPGNVVKYIWRRVFGGKVGEGNVEGLEKAVFYLQDEIERLKAEGTR